MALIICAIIELIFHPPIRRSLSRFILNKDNSWKFSWQPKGSRHRLTSSSISVYQITPPVLRFLKQLGITTAALIHTRSHYQVMSPEILVFITLVLCIPRMKLKNLPAEFRGLAETVDGAKSVLALASKILLPFRPQHR